MLSRLEGSNPSLSAFFVLLQVKYEPIVRESKGRRRQAGGPLLQPYCNPSAERLVHRGRQAIPHPGQHVAVGVQGYGYGGVPQQFLHELDVHAFAEQ